MQNKAEKRVGLSPANKESFYKDGKGKNETKFSQRWER
jgi:hypothetical protein